jgi:hypothetical protein
MYTPAKYHQFMFKAEASAGFRLRANSYIDLGHLNEKRCDIKALSEDREYGAAYYRFPGSSTGSTSFLVISMVCGKLVD